MANFIDRNFLREFEFPKDILVTPHWEELGVEPSELMFHEAVGHNVRDVMNHYVAKYVCRHLCGYVSHEVEDQLIDLLISVHMDAYLKDLDEMSRL